MYVYNHTHTRTHAHEKYIERHLIQRNEKFFVCALLPTRQHTYEERVPHWKGGGGGGGFLIKELLLPHHTRTATWTQAESHEYTLIKKKREEGWGECWQKRICVCVCVCASNTRNLSLALTQQTHSPTLSHSNLFSPTHTRIPTRVLSSAVSELCLCYLYIHIHIYIYYTHPPTHPPTHKHTSTHGTLVARDI